MRYAYPPYDFIIIAFLTCLIGFILNKTLFKKINFNSKHYLVPYAIAFLFVSIGFAFIIDELPLKFYAYEEEGVYNPQLQMGPNPQGPTPNLIWFLVQYNLSIVFNLLLAIYSLFIIARYYLSRKRQSK